MIRKPRSNRKDRLLPLIIGLLMLAACAPAGAPVIATAVVEPAQPASPTAAMQPDAIQPTATPTAPLPTPAPVPTQPEIDPAALCPAPTNGMTAHIDAAHGYCFLYPSDLTLQADPQRPDDVTIIVGQPLDPPEKAMESPRVTFAIAFNGPADGLDSAAYAARWQEYFTPGLDLAFQDTTTLAGEPVPTTEDLDGLFAGRGAFAVVDGFKYMLSLHPLPGDIPELEAEATQLWETVTNSLVFFPPQQEQTVVRPADVCPTETPGTRLLVDEAGGYCLLVPADFDPDPDFPGRILGGPELGPVSGFDSLRASLSVGMFYLGESDASVYLRPTSEQIDPASVQRTTIAGQPAVVYDFTGGPWRQRNAQIVAGDSIYTFVAQPWDQEMFPQAQADVERLWQAATGSIAFFDRWN